MDFAPLPLAKWHYHAINHATKIPEHPFVMDFAVNCVGNVDNFDRAPYRATHDYRARLNHALANLPKI